MTRIIKKLILLIPLFIGMQQDIISQEIHPDDLEFRRQATRRNVFDAEQGIPLSGMWPAKVVDFDVMHPAAESDSNTLNPSIVEGKMLIKGDGASTTTRWIGAFNPFATFDIAIDHFVGSGHVGFLFRDEKENTLLQHILFAMKTII